jgi:hypothetical protein
MDERFDCGKKSDIAFQSPMGVSREHTLACKYDDKLAKPCISPICTLLAVPPYALDAARSFMPQNK